MAVFFKLKKWPNDEYAQKGAIGKVRWRSACRFKGRKRTCFLRGGGRGEGGRGERSRSTKDRSPSLVVTSKMTGAEGSYLPLVAQALDYANVNVDSAQEAKLKAPKFSPQMGV